MVIYDLEEKLNENNFYMGVPALVVEVLSCGINEYWIVNPLNKEVTIFRFAAQGISDNITFRKGETAQSFIFKGLSVELDRVFK